MNIAIVLRPRLLTLLTAFVAIACSSNDDREDCEAIARVHQPIRLATGGTLATLGSWRQNILRLRIVDDETGAVRGCSATRIATGALLTARHCFDGLRSFSGHVSRPLTSNGACLTLGAEVDLQWVLGIHPELDLMAFAFDDESTADGLRLMARATPIGQSVLLAGYGLTEQGSSGQLRAVWGQVVADDDESSVIRVQADGGGACVGDSGGPLLQERHGELTLTGVLSAGSASCEGEDHYIGVRGAGDWLREAVPDASWADAEMR